MIESSYLAQQFGAVSLNTASRQLITRAAIQQRVARDLQISNVTVFSSAPPSQSDDDDWSVVEDYLNDLIANESTPVWESVIHSSADDFSVAILEFVGIYTVWTPEHDPVGYFLSKDDALQYVFGIGWDVESM
jgi:hypothetical protein